MSLTHTVHNNKNYVTTGETLKVICTGALAVFLITGVTARQPDDKSLGVIQYLHVFVQELTLPPDTLNKMSHY